MDIADINTILREGVFIVLQIGGPMLVVSMVVGVTISIFQSITSVQEQSMSFAFKVAAVGSIVYFGGDTMMQILIDYTERIFMLMLE